MDYNIKNRYLFKYRYVIGFLEKSKSKQILETATVIFNVNIKKIVGQKLNVFLEIYPSPMCVGQNNALPLVIVHFIFY